MNILNKTILGRYKNGNYITTIYDDGTKVRLNPPGKYDVEFPESIDLNITNRCDGNCEYCYANANELGKHGKLINVKFFDALRPHTELAINLNDMSHPQLEVFLKNMVEKKIYVGATINQKHLEENLDRIKDLNDKELIKGLGISLNKVSDKFLNSLEDFDNVVIHVINRIINVEDLDRLKKYNILILGYKDLGRGKDYQENKKSEMMEKNRELRKYIKYNINSMRLSFDNLALEQLDIKSIINDDKRWNMLYMGDDGSHTMYIDLVDQTFSQSSISEEKYNLKNDIIDMFNRIKK